MEVNTNWNVFLLIALSNERLLIRYVFTAMEWCIEVIPTNSACSVSFPGTSYIKIGNP